MLIGYRGVLPGDDADQGAQRRALAEAGCEQVVDEQLDPEDGGGRPELDGLITRLSSGDVLVVPRLDSLGGFLPDVVRRVQRIVLSGAGLRSLTEPLDPIASKDEAGAAASESLTPGGRGARERTGTGWLAGAATRPRAGGRPPKLSREQQAAVADEVLSGRQTAAGMARRYRVSQATISRLLAARRAVASVSSLQGAAGTACGFL